MLLDLLVGGGLLAVQPHGLGFRLGLQLRYGDANAFELTSESDRSDVSASSDGAASQTGIRNDNAAVFTTVAWQGR